MSYDGKCGRLLGLEGGEETLRQSRLTGNGAVSVLRQVVLGLKGCLSESAAHVAVGKGWGLEAAVVEEKVGFSAGDAPEVPEPRLVGAGVGQDL